MAKNEIEATVTYSFLCGVRGFQVYKEVWKPILRERLNFSHGRKNLHDRYAIAAYKRLPGRLADSINGHLPRSLGLHLCVCFFLRGEVPFFPLLAFFFRCDLIYIVLAKIAVCKSPAQQEANSAKYLNKEILQRFVFCRSRLPAVWVLLYICRVWTIVV